MAKRNRKPDPTNFASAFRGIYSRIASRLHVHPSYVSRVARHVRQSEEIEAAIDQENRRIMKMMNVRRSEVGQRRIKKVQTVKA
jgi:hypothetical protein